MQIKEELAQDYAVGRALRGKRELNVEMVEALVDRSYDLARPYVELSSSAPFVENRGNLAATVISIPSGKILPFQYPSRLATDSAWRMKTISLNAPSWSASIQ